MDAEDTVVDLEGVTAPEKPAAPAQDSATAATTTAAEDEPSLTDDANPWQKPSTTTVDGNGDSQGGAPEEERPAKKPRTEIMRDTSSKRRGARMVSISGLSRYSMRVLIGPLWTVWRAAGDPLQLSEGALQD